MINDVPGYCKNQPVKNQGSSVYRRGNRYQSKMRLKGKLIHLGTFDSFREAEIANLLAKASRFREVAATYPDDRVVNGLIKHAKLLEIQACTG